MLDPIGVDAKEALDAPRSDGGEPADLAARETAALRRVATLVAEGASVTDLFRGVSEEIVHALGVPSISLDRFDPGRMSTVVASLNAPGFPVGRSWPIDGPCLSATVLETGRPARIDDYSALEGTIAASVRDSGVRSAAGAPIVVDGAVWGMIWVGTTESTPLPDGIELRLVDFTELVGIAVSNAETRDRRRSLADQEASLRRVATLVAEGALPAQVFAAVAEEAARILDVSSVSVVRYEEDGTSTVVASVADPSFPVGSRWPPDGSSLNTKVRDTARPARIDDFAHVPGPVAAAAREAGVESGIGVPVTVDGAVWGMVAVGRKARRPEGLPGFTGSYTGRMVLSTESAEEIEARLIAFTELVAAAISRTQALDDVRRLADEQAALHRVATLVAESAPSARLYTAVLDEVSEVLGAPAAWLLRYEPDRSMEVLAVRNDPAFPVGSRWPLEGASVSAAVFETGRPARIDDYSKLDGAIAARTRDSEYRSSLGVPITVDGAVWGAICIGTSQSEPLPVDSEERLGRFTELVATAISNVDAREQLQTFAKEQAALRRVATLVARDASPEEVFDAVAAEVGELLDASLTVLGRYDDDGAAAIGTWSASPPGIPVGTRTGLGGRNVTTIVAETGKPARLDDHEGATGEAAEIAHQHGWRSSIAAPIVVEGRLWGVMLVATTRPESFPPGAEVRLAGFTELVATAVANATARSELIASRARIVAAGDDARRRVERDLHDGTQQRLVALGLDLQRVRATVPQDREDVRSGLEHAQHDLESIVEEVRELSRGLHPAQLSRGGLGPSLTALARRAPLDVELAVDVVERPSPPIETAAYYVVSEALTNTIKHSRASTVSVGLESDRDGVRATISDDGVGGADARLGSGLTGLADRVEALGGRFALESPSGGGTTIRFELPVDPPQPA